jgi:hypothetical protein
MADSTFKLSDLQGHLTLNDDIDPDSNFFDCQNFETKCFSPSEASNFLTSFKLSKFSILNINIRSMHKNFENFKSMLHDLDFQFKIISITETWSKGGDLEQDSNFQVPNYSVIHQPRADEKQGGGVCVFIHESLRGRLHV